MIKILKKIANAILRPKKYYDFANESIKETFKYTASIVFVSVYTYLIFLYVSVNNSIIHLITDEKAAKMTSIGVEQLKEILDFIFKYNVPIFIAAYMGYLMLALLVSIFGSIILNFNHKCDVKYVGVLKMSMYVLTLPLLASLASLTIANELVPIEAISVIVAVYFFIIAYMKGSGEE